MTNACTWSAPLVTLADGRQVPSDSELWRAETEARVILAIPHEKRHELLQGIAAKRGPESLARLQDLMDAIEPAFVLDLPSKDVRRAYAGRVEFYQGQNAREALEGKVLALWEARKATPASSPPEARECA